MNIILNNSNWKEYPSSRRNENEYFKRYSWIFLLNIQRWKLPWNEYPYEYPYALMYWTLIQVLEKLWVRFSLERCSMKMGVKRRFLLWISTPSPPSTTTSLLPSSKAFRNAANSTTCSRSKWHCTRPWMVLAENTTGARSSWTASSRGKKCSQKRQGRKSGCQVIWWLQLELKNC